MAVSNSRQPASFLRRLVEAFPGGVAYIDRNLIFTFCNEVQAKYLGRRPAEIIGKALHDVIPDDPDFWLEIERVVQAAEQSPQIALSVVWTERPEEGEHHYLISYVTDMDRRGRARGVFMTTLEVTDSIVKEREIESGLRNRNEALEETIKERDLLVGIVSHELRTPLTTIFGNASLLLRRLEDLDADSRTQAVRDIREEAEHLNRLVENMLLLARSGTEAPIPTEPVVVEKVLARVVKEHQTSFSDRPIITLVRPKTLLANAQPDYMKQVVQNLLSNAEKYSPAREKVEIRARRAGDEVIVSVADRGPGILPSESEIIFQPFYRSERTLTKASGAGIGLAVCKLLVQAQSGRIWADQRRGGGAVFSFTLPVVVESDHSSPERRDG